MKEVNNQTANLEALGLAQPKQKFEKQKLGQEDFLRLMTTQMNNQDPMKPMQNGDFLGQMAQFSAVTGLKEIKDSFNTLAASMKSAQALQASGMVGREVLIPAETLKYSGQQKMEGAVEVPPGNHDVKVIITDASGSVVKELELQAGKDGLVTFAWDAIRQDGNKVDNGTYYFNAVSSVDGESTSLKTYLLDSVKSVSLGRAGEGVSLNLASSGRASMADVAEVR